MAGGRNTKLTPKIREALCDAIRMVGHVEVAADYAGIGKTTFYEWMKKGAEEKAEPAFREFREAVEQARARAQVRNSTLIQNAAIRDWKAAAWWLRNAFPETWTGTDKVEVSGPKGGPIELEAKPYDPYDPERLAEFIQGLVESGLIPAEAVEAIIRAGGGPTTALE